MYLTVLVIHKLSLSTYISTNIAHIPFNSKCSSVSLGAIQPGASLLPPTNFNACSMTGSKTPLLLSLALFCLALFLKESTDQIIKVKHLCATLLGRVNHSYCVCLAELETLILGISEFPIV